MWICGAHSYVLSIYQSIYTYLYRKNACLFLLGQHRYTYVLYVYSVKWTVTESIHSLARPAQQ